MTLKQAQLYVRYSQTRPEGITVARWNAILTQLAPIVLQEEE